MSLSLEKPLCVDLDGTLVLTDTLHESVFLLLRKNLFYFFPLVFWLFKGVPVFKKEVMQRSRPRAHLLPYHEELMIYLKQEKNKGRKLILVTGTNELMAREISEHVGLFDECLASSISQNLIGDAKHVLLEKKFGPKGFDYIGTSWSDVVVWSGAQQSLLVSSSKKWAHKIHRHVNITHIFMKTNFGIKGLIKLLRCHQWVKNVLIIAPLILAHKIGEGGIWLHAVQAFFAMSFLSSSVYIANDLIDLESDRAHVSKKKRPIAAGTITPLEGIFFFLITFGVSIFLAWDFSWRVYIALGFYFVLAMLYSFWLKRLLLADVIVLAGLYSSRIFIGSQVFSIPLSPWFIAFSSFFFLSLALVKRYAELHNIQNGEVLGRGYRASDKPLVASMGIASGYLAVLVLALYLSSPEVVLLYSRPYALWLLCPLFFYWISRIWLLTHRGLMHEDPIVFALKDAASYIFVILVGLVLLAGVL